MKTKLFSLLLAGSAAFMSAQTVLFEDSFETYTDFAIAGVGNWTLTDVDQQTTYGFNGITFPNSGAKKAFQVYNSTTSTPATTPSATSNWTGRTGVKAMVAFASTKSPWNNDWMISPKIQLGASGNKVNFWAKGCDAQYGSEMFKVHVSTTDTSVVSFIALTPNIITTPSDATYHEYTFDLDAYAGQNVHIAIQCLSQDQFGFMVDDFKVTATTLATANVDKTGVSVYPNPTADYLNFKGKVSAVEIFDLTGKKSGKTQEAINNTVDVRNLPKGVYIIRFSTEKGVQTEKFIKK